MIIGISGKIGSGKDLVGKIVRYLTMCNIKLDYTEKQFNEFIPFLDKSKWEIVKFADKLKECTSLILNIPREDLEKIEVKNRVLGEEWIRYAYASGFTKDNNGDTTMLSTDCDKERYNLELKTNWQTAYKREYTVRDFLQRFGTDACRDQVHPNFWVNALFSEYKQDITHIDYNTEYEFDTITNKGNFDKFYPNWIITDMRFPNELEAVKSREGITIRVNRSLAFAPANGEGVKKHIENNQHPSETALDTATFDYVLDNNSTIEELIVKVKEILIKEKIL